jgi:hypothetical protein
MIVVEIGQRGFQKARPFGIDDQDATFGTRELTAPVASARSLLCR